jgi:hypothetical protein
LHRKWVSRASTKTIDQKQIVLSSTSYPLAQRRNLVPQQPLPGLESYHGVAPRPVRPPRLQLRRQPNPNAL